ncbi:ATP-grasp domain-containing protein [Jeotgalicoccus psychrophilus]|uniref:ATP-grasp domain-containing protein n=1 Tax=Jeotgalicoccus psychrophilus TaxID=157228 RepID=UPI00047BE3CC|nr:ATP-grasp domain-containing protein [Jeotgalicoccus psychrophilus]
MCKDNEKNGRTEEDGLILVQDFMDGFEVRATILEGHLISVVARVPAFVKGDGIKTIEELIDEKNKARQACGFLSKNLIKKSDAVKAFIGNEGYTFKSVPNKESYVLLLSVSNTSFGGEVVEITDSVSEETRELALNSLAALPDMSCGGIDIMIRDFEDTAPRVIEINPFPVLGLTTYPTYGKPQNPFKYFIEAFYTKDKLIYNLPLNPHERKTTKKLFGLFNYSSKKNDLESLNSDLYIRNYFKYFERQHEMLRRQYSNKV